MDYIMKVINLKEKETTSNLETHDLTEDSVDMSQTDEDINKDDTIGIARTPTAKKRNLSPKKGIKRNVVPKESTMHAAINELKDLNKSLRLPLEEKENECDIIGKHITVQLKQLSVPDMLNANAEMQQVLTKYRLKNLYNPHASTPSTSCTTPIPTASEHSFCSTSQSPPHLYSQYSHQTVHTSNTMEEMSSMANDTDDLVAQAILNANIP
ncbi:uncharacterized protein LOC130450156 [Diorhabda sublineata]|uniref:uncharacterized protein LOC130450156 n=1 Tax=Diorhabda sublineata TaxID=1163346 RepID=UPI0024E0F65A|nr:uncharacterized protein LOC130450156 [Diorhabda sublineata]